LKLALNTNGRRGGEAESEASGEPVLRSAQCPEADEARPAKLTTGRRITIGAARKSAGNRRRRRCALAAREIENAAPLKRH